MMKLMLYIGLFVLVFIAIALIGLSLWSRKPPESGLVNGQLRACPATPNCVCSEFKNTAAYIEPLTYTIAPADAWQKIKQAIAATGGELILENGHYLHARYVTPLMRFVDDVEIRLDEDQHVLHIRSASRVGHSDLGANRKRVERIRQVL